MKSLKAFLAFALLISFTASPAFAESKKEAKKKIETLNADIKKAADTGDLQKGIDAAEEAFEISARVFGEDSMEAANAMVNLANLYMYAEDPAGAENLLKKAILNMSQTDMKSTDVADAYFNLAMSYAMQTKYDEARKSMNLALQIRTEKLGEEHEQTQKARRMFEQLMRED